MTCMGVAAPNSAHDRAIEIRVRFEPGLGAALYASLHDGLYHRPDGSLTNW